MALLARTIITIAFLAIGLFSVFGFLASFESGINTVAWATGYAILGLSSLVVAVSVSWPLIASSGNNAR